MRLHRARVYLRCELACAAHNLLTAPQLLSGPHQSALVDAGTREDGHRGAEGVLQVQENVVPGPLLVRDCDSSSSTACCCSRATIWLLES
jgi:hypothetical protein